MNVYVYGFNIASKNSIRSKIIWNLVAHDIPLSSYSHQSTFHR